MFENLYDFLEGSIIKLDQKETSLGHFPLVFLMENAKYLGFAPASAVEFLTENEKFLIILDGYDEMPDTQRTEHFNINAVFEFFKANKIKVAK